MKKYIFVFLCILIVCNLPADELIIIDNIAMHFLINFSYSFGPESGYNFFPMGIPKVNIGVIVFDIYYIGAFGNLNFMGYYLSGGFNTGLNLWFLLFEASYCWAKVSDVSYQAFNYFLGFSIPGFGEVKKIFLKVGQSFIVHCSDIQWLNAFFYSFDSFYWNIEIGVRLKT